MLNLFKFLADSHYAESGHVYCPVRKSDLEIDNCFGCRRLLEVEKDKGRVRAIRCSGSASVAPEAGVYVR